MKVGLTTGPSPSTTMVLWASTSPIIRTAFGVLLILFLPQPCTTLTPTSQSFSVHRDGEVWAATLWDLRTQLGATITDRIVLNGMKFTPTRPSFLNARDGILQADQNLNGGANRCAIWTVFARHGMGVSAVGNDGTTHIAATDVPADCGGTCSFSINPTSASFAAAGGSGKRDGDYDSWLQLDRCEQQLVHHYHVRRSGSGNGTVNYSVAANTSSLSRSGSLTIAGLTHSVSQEGRDPIPCPRMPGAIRWRGAVNEFHPLDLVRQRWRRF